MPHWKGARLFCASEFNFSHDGYVHFYPVLKLSQSRLLSQVNTHRAQCTLYRYSIFKLYV